MLNPLRVITLFEQIPDQVRVIRKVHIKSYWPLARTTLRECCSEVFRLCITEIEFWFSSSEIQSFVLQYLHVYVAVKIYYNLLTKVLNSVWLLLFSVLLAKGDIGTCRPENFKKKFNANTELFPMYAFTALLKFNRKNLFKVFNKMWHTCIFPSSLKYPLFHRTALY